MCPCLIRRQSAGPSVRWGLAGLPSSSSSLVSFPIRSVGCTQPLTSTDQPTAFPCLQPHEHPRQVVPGEARESAVSQCDTQFARKPRCRCRCAGQPLGRLAAFPFCRADMILPGLDMSRSSRTRDYCCSMHGAECLLPSVIRRLRVFSSFFRLSNRSEPRKALVLIISEGSHRLGSRFLGGGTCSPGDWGRATANCIRVHAACMKGLACLTLSRQAPGLRGPRLLGTPQHSRSSSVECQDPTLSE